ncbi:glycoside hydrolase family 16 protein [Hymenobacter elongatus]|uniref:Glycoside hydrolase family 16 protein n=1 Tax=Hymenobacter elongatus TaxID=877208 RepID=A0A4Z0PNP6_9BACT|nr:glycoside hydrolase family 16 protein [Hymenobacter elongatus]TGE16132.1 glycoside hydrolase family 16 protein [Hymenobacter elongatus]
MIRTSLFIRPRLLMAVAMAAVTGLLSCTQEPDKVLPAPKSAEPVVNEEARDYSQYTELAWSDEFTGGQLDDTKWTYEVQDTWFNNELQATTNSPKNLFLAGGVLNIQAQKEVYNGKNYTSARIITRGKKDFGFGRLDVRARLPKGKGIWPAIWMLGSNDQTVPWPACGEIDIMELRGSTPNVNISTVHFGTVPADRKQIGTTKALDSGDFSQAYHTFTFIRSKDMMRWYLDGVEYFKLTPAQVSPYPFNNPFYVILNVAVGGDFDGNPDASTLFPQRMEVEYVKFWNYK